MRLLTGKFGKFWLCGSCGLTLNDDKGKPQKVDKCPICGSLAVRIDGKKGYFWLCRNKDCKKTKTAKKPSATIGGNLSQLRNSQIKIDSAHLCAEPRGYGVRGPILFCLAL